MVGCIRLSGTIESCSIWIAAAESDFFYSYNQVQLETHVDFAKLYAENWRAHVPRLSFASELPILGVIVYLSNGYETCPSPKHMVLGLFAPNAFSFSLAPKLE